MNKLYLLLIYAAISLRGVWGLSIDRLTVPSIVREGATNITLSCDYSVEEWEKNDEFVLKWYINSVHLVYQWIPHQKPQVLGRLRGHVDTSSRNGGDPWKDHGHLRITHPTVEFSGTYSCRVGTFESEDTKMAEMLVWSPAESITVDVWRPSEYVVNFTCTATEVYPKPEMRLLIIDPEGYRRRIRIRVKNHSFPESSTPTVGSVHSSGLLAYKNLRTGSTLICQIYTPGTGYRESSQIFYSADIPVISTTQPPYLPEEEAVRSANVASASPELITRGAQYLRTCILVLWTVGQYSLRL